MTSSTPYLVLVVTPRYGGDGDGGGVPLWWCGGWRVMAALLGWSGGGSGIDGVGVLFVFVVDLVRLCRAVWGGVRVTSYSPCFLSDVSARRFRWVARRMPHFIHWCAFGSFLCPATCSRLRPTLGDSLFPRRCRSPSLPLLPPFCLALPWSLCPGPMPCLPLIGRRTNPRVVSAVRCRSTIRASE